MSVNMKVIYLAHRVEGELFHNQLRVLAICKQLAMPNLSFYSPILALGGHCDMRTAEAVGLYFAQVTRVFEKRFPDEVWIVSDQTASVQREARLAKQFSVPVHDLWEGSPLHAWHQEQLFNLNTTVRKLAHLGIASQIASKESGCSSCGHDHGHGNVDKSGTTEMVDESLNVAVEALKRQVKGLGDPGFSVTAFPLGQEASA